MRPAPSSSSPTRSPSPSAVHACDASLPPMMRLAAGLALAPAASGRSPGNGATAATKASTVAVVTGAQGSARARRRRRRRRRRGRDDSDGDGDGDAWVCRRCGPCGAALAAAAAALDGRSSGVDSSGDDVHAHDTARDALARWERLTSHDHHHHGTGEGHGRGDGSGWVCSTPRALRFPLYALSRAQPTTQCKTVYLIRHAQSLYNQAHSETFADPLVRDAPLSALGVWQATQLAASPAVQRLVARHPSSARAPRIEVVISSPLTRALQTALAAFPQPPPPPSPPPHAQSLPAPTPLRVPRVRFAVSAHHSEFVDAACDVGQSPAALCAAFPEVAHALTDAADALPDLWWPADLDRYPRDPARPDTWGLDAAADEFTCEENGQIFSALEPTHSKRLRVHLCTHYLLRARPEQRLALVGHSDFFHALTGCRVRMQNCDVLKCRLTPAGVLVPLRLVFRPPKPPRQFMLFR